MYPKGLKLSFHILFKYAFTILQRVFEGEELTLNAVSRVSSSKARCNAVNACFNGMRVNVHFGFVRISTAKTKVVRWCGHANEFINSFETGCYLPTYTNTHTEQNQMTKKIFEEISFFFLPRKRIKVIKFFFN